MVQLGILRAEGGREESPPGHRLNKFVRRPTHPFPSTREIIEAIPPEAKLFCKLDAVHGYFQLALDENSSRLITFLLPQGRFRYLRAPMGLNASSDEWCRQSDIIIAGLPYAMKIVDDTIICAATESELEDRVSTILQRCADNNITISRKKFEMGNSIQFAGHIISDGGIRPTMKSSQPSANSRNPRTSKNCVHSWAWSHSLACLLYTSDAADE